MRYIIQNEREKGQAIVMVTLALMAMCGILGLAVDFGWAFFVKRAAQAAADTGALAAAQALRTTVGAIGPYNCYQNTCRTENSPLICTSSVINDANDNLDNACLYAKQNGFIDAGRQRVRVNEGSSGSINGTATPPTRAGLEVQYWVTVRVTETVPQLFSAVMGNPWATVSARATAAIMEAESEGSLRLINREGDSIDWGSGQPVAGVNLDGQANTNQGNYSVDAQGGILMASACSGNNCNNHYAGELQGGTTVNAPYTHIRSTGTTSLSNNAAWTTAPVNGKSDGGDFWDPTRGKAQPPLASATGKPVCPIAGGVIDGTQNPVVLGPGYYFATGVSGGQTIATAAQITIRGNVTFGSGGTCQSGSSGPGTFGDDYVFFGGMRVSQQGQGATALTFEPARYVMAGVQQSNGQSPAGTLFDLSSGGNTTIAGTGQNGLGALFIFTDGTGYPGLNSVLARVGQTGGAGADLEANKAATLKQGVAGFQTGNNAQVSISLDGLNKANGTIPDELKPYNATVMWQDRRNSAVRYDPDGNINCGNTATTCAKNGGQLNADGVSSNSPELFLKASPNVAVRGAIYQPRGAWTTLSGGGNYNSALQIITGAVKIQGNANLILTPAPNTIPYSLVALVE